MKKLSDFDLSLIIPILESSPNDYMSLYGYIDLQTGDVLLGSHDSPIENFELDPDEDEGFEDRYFNIPNLGSQPGYQDMVDFIATVTDPDLRRLLEVAISGKGAFRRFKDVIRSSTECDRWYQFSDIRSTERAVDWLQEYVIDDNNEDLDYARDTHIEPEKVIKAVKKREKTECKIANKLQAILGGEREVTTPDGDRIDLLTSKLLIEVKATSAWDNALGQILKYLVHYPEKQPVIFLYNDNYCDLDALIAKLRRIIDEFIKVPVTVASTIDELSAI